MRSDGKVSEVAVEKLEVTDGGVVGGLLLSAFPGSTSVCEPLKRLHYVRLQSGYIVVSG